MALAPRQVVAQWRAMDCKEFAWHNAPTGLEAPSSIVNDVTRLQRYSSYYPLPCHPVKQCQSAAG
ncbi:hypothetical protein VCRA2113O356_220032 [Vibrio crassostreae]|nr:hypothetical protein VCRA2111O320_180061 [Vibrio crassostreae]CAK1903116.1 hypothetical protein VCRA2113O356_220032 [Vibrio crassostreae]CAK2319959.1 hypothetical protein VCRA2119O386_230033 [Vibrio crassostreae]CAK2690563.1 hypothetical protein VCRA2121O336_180063 [Vibrio crassostreae]CAK2804072.1 hypothetical protein VCRA2133O403_200034 [Vibrio crassostreae]